MPTLESTALREVLGVFGGLSLVETQPGYAYANMYDFVLQHGTEYRGRKLPKPYRMGTVKMCFRNAYNLAFGSGGRLTYVEGFVLSIIPIHHAWCVDEDGQVVDPTLRLDAGEDPTTRQYLGVPMPLELVNNAILLSGQYGVLDDWKHRHPMLQQPFTVEAAIARLRELRSAKEGKAS